MRELHLANGLLIRGDLILLVASRYPNLEHPLWHLPGGRRRAGELLHATLRREFAEETGLTVQSEHLLYLSESFDHATTTHILSATFSVQAQGESRCPLDDAHIVDLAWVPREELAGTITVNVVREPLLAYLNGSRRAYFGFENADVSIVFADET
ncbi:MAG TPA: NUDIX hydrolase [Candidatus Baltobacteraceae bacterium]|nr:NUDIX hydrolase [Candidatus Baltobacteraceae bacterium]